MNRRNTRVMPIKVMTFISGKLKNNSYIVTDYILLTHCHFDHILGLNEIKKYTDAPVVAHHSEADWLIDPDLNGSNLTKNRVVSEYPDILLNGDESLTCGSITIKVIHTPGHSPGSTCFLINDHYLFTGDTLLTGMVGPTNIPFGDRELLVDSIRNKLFSLAGDILVYPGHGRETSIEYERKHNLLPNIKVKYHF